MSREFLPRTDAGLAAWSAHFAAAVAAGDYGPTPQQKAACSASQLRYAGALAAALDPDTRGGSTVLGKNLARQELEALIRQLAGIIRANPAVSDQQRYDLGLTVRKAPSPVPAPGEAPRIDLVSMTGHRMRLRLHNGTGPRRGKPAGVIGASVLSFVGPTPPADLSDWVFQKNTGRTLVELEFDPSLAPGTTVWATAFWFNSRTQPGPAARPHSALIQFPMNGPAAPAGETAGVRRAA
jgi:hypothetical protein